ncbi:hypothetical protein NL676_032440 [Syzygium grande]|nr:hypothetical protein NL676_032440 [Syzygium grande]
MPLVTEEDGAPKCNAAFSIFVSVFWLCNSGSCTRRGPIVGRNKLRRKQERTSVGHMHDAFAPSILPRIAFTHRGSGADERAKVKPFRSCLAIVVNHVIPSWITDLAMNRWVHFACEVTESSTR